MNLTEQSRRYGDILVAQNVKALYRPITKNACSSLKTLFVSIADVEDKEIILRGDIHLGIRKSTNSIHLRNLDQATIAEILASPDYLRFAVVRNPLARLVSVYWEKFVLHRTDLSQHHHIRQPIWFIQQAQRLSAPDFERGISFEQFIQYIISSSQQELDEHWAPQYLQLQGIHYNALYRFEEPELFMQRLRSHTGLSLEMPRKNITRAAHAPVIKDAYRLLPSEFTHGSAQPDVSSFYSGDLLALVRSYFAPDFSLHELLEQRDAAVQLTKETLVKKSMIPNVPSHQNTIIETTKERCRLCSGTLTYTWTLKTLKQYYANYFECNDCHSLLVINPFWLSEAYQKEDELALTANPDQGRFGRNFTTYLYIQALTHSGLIRKSHNIVDFGGGYGLLTAMLRQSGYDAWTFDEYIDKPLLSGNYHIDDLSVIPDQSVDVITAFEVLEHLSDPVSTWRHIRRILKEDGTLLVSTCLYDAAVHQQDWFYLTPEQGQHITLWSDSALRKYAKDFGFSSGQAFPSFATANQGFSVFILSSVEEETLSACIQRAEKAIHHLPEQHIFADWDVSGVQKAIAQNFELSKVIPLVEKKKYQDAANYLLEQKSRYGWYPKLEEFVEQYFIPHLDTAYHILPVDKDDYIALLSIIAQGDGFFTSDKGNDFTEICEFSDAAQLQIKVLEFEILPGTPVKICKLRLALSNYSHKVLTTLEDSQHPVYISYHWLDAETMKNIIVDGERTRIYPPVGIDKTENYQCLIPLPVQEEEEKAAYILRMTLVQERVGWFDDAQPPVFDDVLIEIA